MPLPEPYLLGVGAAVWLDRRWPSALPGPRYVHHLVGWPLAVAGVRLIARSWTAAMPVKLADPALLVTSGPYAASRNPMYVGWALLQLGAGLVRGSWWMIAAVPVAAALVHRGVRGEEETLENAFGEQFRRYRATVPRYLPLPGQEILPRPRRVNSGGPGSPRGRRPRRLPPAPRARACRG